MTEDNMGPEVGVPDDALPPDLVPSEDNPLAEGLPPGETVDGMHEGEDEGEDAESDAEQT